MTMVPRGILECLPCIVQYLNVADLFRFYTSNRQVHDYLNAHESVWNECMIQILLANAKVNTNWLMMNPFDPQMISFDRSIYLYNGHINCARHILRRFLRRCNSGVVTDLTKKVVDVSSVDRWEECAKNVTAMSTCYRMITALTAMGETDPNLGIYCQSRCGCTHTHSCYWSSMPSANNSQVEHLTFELMTPVTVVVGFYITPYQAYFHNSNPVYGPNEVCLQILRPSHIKREYAPLPSVSHRAHCKISHHQQVLQDPEVCYQSDFYPVRNVASEQYFLLPDPVLCIGGTVRIVFRGMQQRQTVFPGLDDYYLCISRADVIGVPYPHVFIVDAPVNNTTTTTTTTTSTINTNATSSTPMAGPRREFLVTPRVRNDDYRRRYLVYDLSRRHNNDEDSDEEFDDDILDGKDNESYCLGDTDDSTPPAMRKHL